MARLDVARSHIQPKKQGNKHSGGRGLKKIEKREGKQYREDLHKIEG